jgi:tellurite resistance protein TerC
MFTPQFPLWIIFICLVGALLYIDLRAARANEEAPSFSSSARHVALLAAAALLFALLLWWRLGHEKALTFLTAYVVEYSLSADNLFVFMLIFSAMNIPLKQQPRVLEWGIFGAMLMRLIMILAGVALVSRFHWALYIFGALLIWMAWKMTSGNNEKPDPKNNRALAFVRKYLPFSDEPSALFFIRTAQGLCATPLFAALVVIETSDVIFALDSIPAVLAISQDTLIVYSSNILAVLGLRALYFMLSKMMGIFSGFKYGVAAVLFFVGAKMLCYGIIPVSSGTSLLVILFLLCAGTAAAHLLCGDKAK